MSNYIEYGNKVAFHPGYYIKELVEESGLTQEDFAKRLDTTPKNLSILINGQQSLSTDIAAKLSRMVGTSVEYWLNLQKAYDAILAEIDSGKELEKEKLIFKTLDYTYFTKNFDLPILPRKIDEQIFQLRKFLGVSSLTVFEKKDIAVSFRSASTELNNINIIKANIMVQIAINYALRVDAPKYDKTKFMEAAQYALTLTRDHSHFISLIQKKFINAGVILVILPNLSGSKINGATKKIGNNILLMVNDRRLYSDCFWFTLFHEIGHIINGDYGISVDGEHEDAADAYARESLIPHEEYQKFVNHGIFTAATVVHFADYLNRDPGIIVGRLERDKYINYGDSRFTCLKKQYKVKIK